MRITRLLRVAAIAVALPAAFTVSQRVTEVGGNEPLPGTLWALGVLSALFLVRAVVTEWSRGREAELQKDLLWGLAAGGFLSIASRL